MQKRGFDLSQKFSCSEFYLMAWEILYGAWKFVVIYCAKIKELIILILKLSSHVYILKQICTDLLIFIWRRNNFLNIGYGWKLVLFIILCKFQKSILEFISILSTTILL